MTLQEVIEKITYNTQELKLAQALVTKLSVENTKLNQLKKQLEISQLLDYIQIGDELVIETFTPLKGIQLSNKTSKLSPAFRPGDKLQFIRKNTKSIVIKATNKHRQTLHPSHIYDGALFRVDMESLYYNLMRNTTYWNIFQTYLKRKESIEKLGI